MAEVLTQQQRFSAEILKKEPDFAVLEECFAQGARINGSIFNRSQKETKDLALHVAVRSDAIKLRQWLLDRDAEPVLLDGSGENAIQNAAKFGALNCMKLLVQHGVSLARQS